MICAEHDDESMASVALVASRIASAPGLARLVLDAPRDWPALEGAVVTTGIGASAGPARYLASLLGPRARFAPLSAFASGGPPADTLVLVSQHLCPNARLALARAGAYRRVVVLTAAPGARDALGGHAGAHAVLLPPHDERGTLLRLVGPLVAMVAAAKLAEASGVALKVADVAARLAAERPPVPRSVLARALDGPIAIVGAGETSTARAIGWKLLEGWSVAEPHAWDVLEVAHGPLQQFYRGPLTIFAFGAREDAPLFERLASVVVADRHVLWTFCSELPPALAPIEHDAVANEILLAGLALRPRDLTRWDAQGRDGALYDLGA